MPVVGYNRIYGMITPFIIIYTWYELYLQCSPWFFKLKRPEPKFEAQLPLPVPQQLSCLALLQHGLQMDCLGWKDLDPCDPSIEKYHASHQPQKGIWYGYLIAQLDDVGCVFDILTIEVVFLPMYSCWYSVYSGDICTPGRRWLVLAVVFLVREQLEEMCFVFPTYMDAQNDPCEIQRLGHGVALPNDLLSAGKMMGQWVLNGRLWASSQKCDVKWEVYFSTTLN